MIKQLIILIVLLFTSTNAWAVTAWWDNNGAAAWGDCQGAAKSGAAACSLSTINANISGGDTAWGRTGTYTTGIAPVNSGSEGNEIRYQNYNNEVITFTGNFIAVDLVNKSYVIVDGTNEGIRFIDVARWVYARPGGTYNTIQNCYMEEASAFVGISLRDGAHWNKILSNTIIGYCRPADLIQIWDSSNNLIQGNKMYYGSHDSIDVQDRTDGESNYNVIRNNYIENHWHTALDLLGPEYLLCENNIIVDGGENYTTNMCGSDRDRTSSRRDHKGIGGGTRYGIYRNNIVINNGYFFSMVSYGLGSSDPWKGISSYNRIYNNTVHENNWGVLHNYAEDPFNNIFKNNVLYQQTVYAIGNTGYTGTTNSYINNDILGGIVVYNPTDIVLDNLVVNPLFIDEDGSGPGSIMYFPDGSQANTAFTSELKYNAVNNQVDAGGSSFFITVDKRDLQLQAGSSLINDGAFLTETSQVVTNSVTIPVLDARYFMDGWGMINADQIQFDGQDDLYTIDSIDYGTNTLTLTTQATVNSGVGVSLYYAGSKPDIGAYETDAGGGGDPDVTEPDVTDVTVALQVCAATAEKRVTTDEDSDCRWSLADVAYASMGNTFTTTGLRDHTQILNVECDTAYGPYYVRCIDGDGNANASSVVVNFTIEPPPPTGIDTILINGQVITINNKPLTIGK